MPSASPPLTSAAAQQLDALGRGIRERRKSLHVSATTAAEAAGMSRVTLHRIEAGAPSVTIGAYLNALAALGLAVEVVASGRSEPEQASLAKLPANIRVADYPQLRMLSWHLPGDVELTAEEALGIYERNWRHVDRAAMDPRELALLEALIQGPGKGRLLV